MDLPVVLLGFASFFGGLLVVSRVVSWAVGLSQFLKPSAPADHRGPTGLVLAPLLLHSGPWLLAIAAFGVYYVATLPRSAFLWAVVVGLGLAAAYIAGATLFVLWRQRRPAPEPTPLTAERLLAIKRRFFWRNAFLFAFALSGFFAYTGRAYGNFLFISFVGGFAGGWLWSWFMWQWYGEELKLQDRRRQLRKARECGLTLRCTGRPTAGFARFRPRVNSDVRHHMRFRVTSIADEGLGAKLSQTLCTIEDWLNASLSDGQFGGNLSHVMIVVFATTSLPQEPTVSRTSSFVNPSTGVRERMLALHVNADPNLVVEAPRESLLPTVSKLLIDKLPLKPLRVPNGLDYTRLRSAIAASVNAYAHSNA